MQWLDVPGFYESYLSDESRGKGEAEKIAFPTTVEEIQSCFQDAEQAGKRLTIQGSRTGMMGGALPDGGWILNLSQVKHLGELQKDEDGRSLLTVGAGVTLEEVRKKAGAQGMFFPPNPTEEGATLGGLFATAAAGPNVLYYGPSSKYIQGLTWVTPNGEILEILRGESVSRNGNLRLPNGALLPCGDGMDLIDFLFGSEGKYGAAGALTLRLLPVPKEQWGLLFFFQEEEQALRFGESLRNTADGEDVRLTAAEYYNAATLDLLRKNGSHPLLKDLPLIPAGARAAVHCELEGENDCAELLMELLDRFDGLGGREEDSWAENGPAGVRKLRCIRHAIPSILNELSETKGLQGDFQGPKDQGSAWIRDMDQILEEEKISCAVYGHLLTNGLRAVILEDTGRGRNLLERLSRYAVSHGGSLTGEYGIGRAKAALWEVLEPDACRRDQDLRKLLDPKGRLGERAY